MYDLIKKKRDKKQLSEQEIAFFVDGYTNGQIPDYQASALAMAIFFNGMDRKETVALTMAMANSGDIADLSAIQGLKVDKHSTGGVGDKITLIAAPIAAACGAKVAKMSGRGLGHTGGTIDKLEAIPGYQTCLSEQRFIEITNKTGVSIIGQSGNLAPADKKLYALRDVTATVDSLPLIVSSIMSKKIAVGADCMVFDVKAGSGAFCKSVEMARQLAEELVAVGKGAGKKVTALVTDMNTPLGYNIGNSLEIIEAVEVLDGNGAEDLKLLGIEIAAEMLALCNKGGLEECRKLAQNAITSGRAKRCFVDMVKEHGGDTRVIEDISEFPKAKFSHIVRAKRSGYITAMDTEKLGISALLLGAGRTKKEDKIDALAGIVLAKKRGNFVKNGDILATLYASSKQFEQAEEVFLDAVTIDIKPAEVLPLILARVV
jgi:pyrimidine-nucleoside phosphorylase